jgi:hypothetical protein
MRLERVSIEVLDGNMIKGQGTVKQSCVSVNHVGFFRGPK